MKFLMENSDLRNEYLYKNRNLSEYNLVYVLCQSVLGSE